MQLIACEFAGYRSLHAVRLPLERVSVLVGENGVGKSNMLRSLELLQAAAAGTVCRLLADEGDSRECCGRDGRHRAADPCRPVSG